MAGDRRRGRQRRHVLRAGVHGRAELRDVGEVTQRLNAAGGGTRADGDQRPGLSPDPLDPFRILPRSHRALDQRHIVGAFGVRAGRLGEVGDLNLRGEREQFVLTVEQRELAAVAGSELPHRELWAGWWGRGWHCAGWWGRGWHWAGGWGQGWHCPLRWCSHQSSRIASSDAATS